jgi:hypothetical protein
MTKPADPATPPDGEIDIEAMLTQIVTPLIQQLQGKFAQELARVKTELTTTLDERFKAVESNDKPEPKPEVKEDSAAVRALQAKLEQLEKDRAVERAEIERKELESALKDAVASGNPEDYNLALAGLQHFAGKLTKVDGKYLSENGKDLSALATEFYQSPSGKRTLPSGIKPGNPAPPSGTVPPNTSDAASLDDRLMRGVASI